MGSCLRMACIKVWIVGVCYLFGDHDGRLHGQPDPRGVVTGQKEMVKIQGRREIRDQVCLLLDFCLQLTVAACVCPRLPLSQGCRWHGFEAKVGWSAVCAFSRLEFHKAVHSVGTSPHGPWSPSRWSASFRRQVQNLVLIHC